MRWTRLLLCRLWVANMRMNKRLGLFLLCSSAGLFTALWLLHEDRREIEFVALHPLIAPLVSGGVALCVFTCALFLACQRHEQCYFLKRITLLLITIAAAGIGVLSTANGIAGRHAAAMRPSIVSVSSNAGKHWITIDGRIDRHLPFRLKHVLGNTVGVCRISIRSLGGDLHAARQVGDMLAQRNCIVQVRGRCASACVVIWASAPARLIASDSLIGLHRYSLDGKSAGGGLVNAVEGRSIRRIVDAGFDHARLEIALSSSDTTWLRTDDLEDWGVQFNTVEAMIMSESE